MELGLRRSEGLDTPMPRQCYSFSGGFSLWVESRRTQAALSAISRSSNKRLIATRLQPPHGADRSASSLLASSNSKTPTRHTVSCHGSLKLRLDKGSVTAAASAPRGEFFRIARIRTQTTTNIASSQGATMARAPIMVDRPRPPEKPRKIDQL